MRNVVLLSSSFFKCDFDEPFGPTKKTPWITLNQKEIGDSQMCINHLARTFNKDFSGHLSVEEKAVALAFQIMAEEHLYWCGKQSCSLKKKKKNQQF